MEERIKGQLELIRDTRQRIIEACEELTAMAKEGGYGDVLGVKEVSARVTGQLAWMYALKGRYERQTNTMIQLLRAHKQTNAGRSGT